MSDSARSLSTSLSLIRRVKALDGDAWESLTQLYGPLIYGWARRSGLQSQDAADILQTVFVSVWRGMTKFTLERENASFRGWLRVITANAVREWGRRRETLIIPAAQAANIMAPGDESDGECSEPGLGGADDMFQNLTHRAMELVRNTVDVKTWDAFWKTTIEDVPVMDVAAATQMSAPAVRQAKYRVLCRLRELLADR